MTAAPRYTPYDKGRFQLSLGIRTIEPSEWIEPDRHYAAHLAEKRRLLATRHAEVVAGLPGSEPAQQECLELLTAHLLRDHPGLIETAGTGIRLTGTGESFDRAAFADVPVDLAGRLVQEDLCLMAPTGDTYRLVAASLCFPARWRLADKIGRPMAEIHTPVPGFNDRLARPVDRFFARVEAGQPYMRLNWSVIDDPTLFQPTGHGRTGADPSITAENAGDRLWIRIERQTFVRLPETGVLVFGIKTVVDPLSALAARPDLAAALRDSLAGMPEAMRGYKSLAPFAGALSDWLDRIACQTR